MTQKIHISKLAYLEMIFFKKKCHKIWNFWFLKVVLYMCDCNNKSMSCPMICKIVLRAIQIIIYRATKGKNFKPIKLEHNYKRSKRGAALRKSRMSTLQIFFLHTASYAFTINSNRASFCPFKKSKLQKNRQSHVSLGSPQLLQIRWGLLRLFTF